MIRFFNILSGLSLLNIERHICYLKPRQNNYHITWEGDIILSLHETILSPTA